MKIYFYSCPPELESINLSPSLIPHNFYYSNLVQFLKNFSVENPDDADFFFVPINLIKFQFHPSFKDPANFIEKLPFLGKKPHLLFASGDFGQRSKSPYENLSANRPYPHLYQWLDERFILLAFESTKDLLPQDIALFPYLLNDERALSPISRWVKLPLKRDLLFSFVGMLSYPELAQEHIRGGKLLQFTKKRKRYFVGTPQGSIKRFGRVKGHHIRMFERSKFVLCPAGFGRWTFRLAEAIAYGAIPVLISDSYILPFSTYIPWEKFIIRINENEIHEIHQKLKSIGESHLDLLQKNLSHSAKLLEEINLNQFLLSELNKRKKLITQ